MKKILMPILLVFALPNTSDAVSEGSSSEGGGAECICRAFILESKVLLIAFAWSAVIVPAETRLSNGFLMH